MGWAGCRLRRETACRAARCPVFQGIPATERTWPAVCSAAAGRDFGRGYGRVRWRVAAGVAALMTAAALSGATTAGAQGFGCDASALRGTILGGTAIEPVTANRGQATCRST